MNENETKALRVKLTAFQDWMEDQITKGLMDLEMTPACFDRKRYEINQQLKDNRTIGSHCSQCGQKFKEGEKKETNNHIVFFHAECNV